MTNVSEFVARMQVALARRRAARDEDEREAATLEIAAIIKGDRSAEPEPRDYKAAQSGKD